MKVSFFGSFKSLLNNKRLLILGLLILCALGGLRLIHLTADPPSRLSWSGGLFFDEGALAHNARNKVLFGEWKTDDWNDYYYSPLLTYIKWAVFSVFGVGMVPLRIVPVAFSCLTLWVVFVCLKKISPYGAILGMLLLGVNYIYVIYSRLGLTEIPLAFIMALTLYCWQRGLRTVGRWQSGGFMFFAGVSCFMTYIFKALALYFLPVPLVAFGVLYWRASGRLERLRLVRLTGIFLAGLFLTAGIWLVVFYLPNSAAIHQAGDYVADLSLPRTIAGGWENILRTPFFHLFWQTPIVLIGALGYLGYVIFLGGQRRSNLDPLDLFSGLWFLAHFFFFLAYSYRPTRYYIPIIPPMCLLAARGLTILAQTRHFSIPELPRHWRKRRTIQLPPNLLAGVAMGLACVSLWIDGTQYLRWAAAPQYTVKEISRELGTRLNDALIAGLTAPMLCIENTHRALYVWENFTNYQDTFQKYPVTHLILGEFNDEVGYYQRKFPDIMQRAVLLKTYTIKESRFHLYSIIEPSVKRMTFPQKVFRANEPVQFGVKMENHDPRHARDIEVAGYFFPQDGRPPILTPVQKIRLPAAENDTIVVSQPLPSGTYDLLVAVLPIWQDWFEAETLPGQVGHIRSDAEASGGQARIADPGIPGFVVHGPYQTYPPGGYTATFLLNTDTPEAAVSAVLGTLDVVAYKGAKRLASKNLVLTDCADAGVYRSCTLPFLLKNSQELEFRVFTQGQATLRVDAIQVSMLRGFWRETPITVNE